MFLKFFVKSIKQKKLQYIILILCEVAMLMLAIIANAVMNDNIAQKENIAWQGKYFRFIITKDTPLLEIRDKIYQFSNESPVPIHDIFMYATIGEIFDSITNTWSPSRATTFYFPTYEDLKQEFYQLKDNEIPTEQQFYSDEPLVLVGKGAGYDERYNYEYADENHVVYNGEKLLAIENKILSAPNFLLGHGPSSFTTGGIHVDLREYPSDQQIKEIVQLFEKIFADYFVDDENATILPNTVDLLEVRKASSSIVLTAFAQIISAFNVMLIFKFIIDSRKKQFAVLRLCGFKKSVCLRYSLSELLIVSGISAALACVLIQVLKPTLKTHLSVFVVLYDWGYLLLLALAFLAATVLVFVIYIVPSLGKSVSHELREM